MASGRKGDSEQNAVEAAGMRPSPPDYFDSARSQIWRETIEACPAGWFPPQTLPLLAMYCTHVRDWHRFDALAAKVWDQSKDGQGVDWDTYNASLSGRERERKAVFDMATKMRLTQQSIYHPDKGRNKSKHGKLPHQQ
jgi:hypothetical protein